MYIHLYVVVCISTPKPHRVDVTLSQFFFFVWRGVQLFRIHSFSFPRMFAKARLMNSVYPTIFTIARGRIDVS